MTNGAKSDNADMIPAAYMAKFREWGSAGGKAGDRMAKSRSARKAWSEGGANFHRRRKDKPATAEVTTAEDPLAEVRNA